MVSLKAIALVGVFLLQNCFAFSIDGIQPRIVGGSNSTEAEVPHHCYFLYSTKFVCSCTIVNATFVLTSATCADNLQKYTHRLSTGTNDLTKTGNLYTTMKIYKHPLFDSKRKVNDIALVKINGEIEFNRFAQPIPLASTPVPPNKTVQLSGYVTKRLSVDYPDVLKVSYLTTVSEEFCRFDVGYHNFDEGYMCAASRPGEGICDGDTGAPLTRDGVLVGIANYGYSCTAGIPDVYTSISYYHDWIRTTMQTMQAVKV